MASSRPATSARSTAWATCTIVGRSKDLIISGGYNVYPAEIEGYINEMAGCRRSRHRRRAAFGFRRGRCRDRDPRPGAVLDGEVIIAELKARLANFKIPKRCFVVAELPRNAMGKVQKNILRDTYAKIYTK